MKRVMTIGGSDCSGGAGIQADIKTFSALGVYGTSVITAVTAQNASGVQAKHEVPVELVESQIQSIMSEASDKGITVDYAKTGMLYSSAMIETVAKHLKRHKIPFVVDPVMKAGSGGILLADNALNTLVKLLLPICEVVTPNVPEASVISGLEIRNKEDAKDAAVKIHELGASAVIIKGGHLTHETAAGKATDLIYDGDFVELSGEYIKPEKGKIIHGAGCSFSAALTAELAKGENLRHAAASAKKFVHDAIAGGEELSNMIVLNQARELRKNADRYFVLENVKEAVRKLKSIPDFKRLVPEVGTNIGMAIEGAESERDVAAVAGRIISAKEGIYGETVDFGVSSHVARMILAMMAMTGGKNIRSAINIKYSVQIIDACKRAGLVISSFEREHEPSGVKTMDWGVREAIRNFSSEGQRRQEVPDVIYDLGAVGKEPMTRIFGDTALEVASNVNKIMDALE
ncbi:MAG: bifunctional hydroxymethylpyrimidine kinase/phosphomethylpyrimidine kinase [Methanophagales archaeon]|nr:bifunctional hydroxymethylpyrimidine kinase/phosphomethylpyrimidine kinase [Methanophagales archaeon]